MRWIVVVLVMLSASAGGQPAPADLDSLFIRIDRAQAELAGAVSPFYHGAAGQSEARQVAPVTRFLDALVEMNQWVMAAKLVECERDKEMISSFVGLRYGPALALSEDAMAAVRALEPDTDEERAGKARAIAVIERFWTDTEPLIGAP
jgi:hypothetical protein